MIDFISPLVILLLGVQSITAGGAGHITSTCCCTSKLERATELTSTIDKYEKQYHVARQFLTTIQQECEIVSTMLEHLQSLGCDATCKSSSCELKLLLKWFEGVRSRASSAIKDLRAACKALNDMAVALGKSSKCKYGYSLLGCENDRNGLECKLKAFSERALDELYQSSRLLDIVERTCNILGKQADNFHIKELNCNESQALCKIKNFLAEFGTNNRPARESLQQLDINCNTALSNINKFRAYIIIGSQCC